MPSHFYEVIMIIGKPCFVEKKDILRIAMFYETTYEEIESILSQVWIVNSNELTRLLNDVPSSNIVSINHTYIFGDIIYIKIFQMKDIYYAVGYKLTGIKVWNNVEYSRKILSHLDLLETIRNNVGRVEEYLANIRLCFSKMSNFRIIKPDYKKLASVCRKHKVLLEESAGEFKLTFKNVKIGNETEGYLHYKKIIVTWDKTENKPFAIDFYIENIMIKSEWVFPNSYHPHIGSNMNFCYGNRYPDYEIYCNNYEWGYLIPLMKEQLSSYNPGDAYRSVSSIREMLGNLLKALPTDKTRLKEIRTNEERAHAWWERIAYSYRFCYICGTRLVNGYCPNIENHVQPVPEPELEPLALEDIPTGIEEIVQPSLSEQFDGDRTIITGADPTVGHADTLTRGAADDVSTDSQ